MRSLVSNSIYAKKDRNGPPSANQVASKDEPRLGHAVCTLRVHPPTSLCPALSAHAEPKSQGGVSNLWNGLWNGLMEWTDGMEYWLIKIAKTLHHGHDEVVSAVSTIA